MKLFQRLLVAPAALGLFVPMTATNATEVNLEDISIYSEVETSIHSDVESIDFSNSFNNNDRSTENLLAGGEGLGLGSPDSDSFSSTTVASFSTDFILGAVDGSSNEQVSAGYSYQIDLSTSFTGEDSFFVSIDAGNAGDPLAEMDLNSGGDGLTVDGIGYQFPLGNKTQVVVGESIDGSSLYNTACVYGGFTNTLDDCGNASSAFTTVGDDSTGLSISYDIGGGFTGALGLATASGANGIFGKATQDFVGGQLSYNADNYGISVTYADREEQKMFIRNSQETPISEYLLDSFYYGFNAYYKPDSAALPSLSVGYELGDLAGLTEDTDQWFAGVQWDELGPGTLGAAVGTAGAIGEESEELLMYEAFYAYQVNDSMTITPAIYVQETAAGSEDLTGLVVKTSFSF